MKRMKFIMILAVFVTALAMQAFPAHATRVINPYVPIYEGIEYATGSDDTPRLMKAFVLRIDLQNPNVHMFASHDNGGAYGETTAETPPAFLAGHGLKAAVNANFFSGSDVWGLLVSNGTLVSPPDYAYPFNSQLSFTIDNSPSLTVGNTVPQGAYNAVGGAEIMLQNGVCVSSNPDVQPRTFMGISQDRRYLIIICVDGRQAGWSEGVNHPEAAQWLLDFGAWDGVNFDGGGSTCMVREDVGVVNRPSDGSPRAVAANLGVLSIPIPGAEIIVDNPDGTCSSNWSTGTTASGKYGSDYRYRSTAAVSDPFTWTPNVTTAGDYEVFAWWPAGNNKSASNAPYIINYNGGSQTVYCDQRVNGGKWNSLGVYNFAAGTSGNIQLSCWTTLKKTVTADAIRLFRR